MRIIENIKDTRNLIGPEDLWRRSGELIVLHSKKGHIVGPYIVCMESTQDPRASPEMINGSFTTFLVNVGTGHRRNVEGGDKYEHIKATLTLED